MKEVLTPYQQEMLKKHVYKSQGCSITETLILKHFWNWLTAQFPIWLAPNTITLVGLAITITTTLSVILQDLNCEGKVSAAELDITLAICCLGACTSLTCGSLQALCLGHIVVVVHNSCPITTMLFTLVSYTNNIALLIWNAIIFQVHFET